MRKAILVLACVALAAVWFAGLTYASDPVVGTMVKPAYNDNGELILPTDYEDWVFVGASLGLSYNENLKREGPGNFHHIYIQPEAYEHYKSTGTFPEKTMLVMENFSAGSKVNPNLSGYFEDEMLGMEVALKDSETFEESWAYFNFSSTKGLKPAAKAFPKAVCFDCHDQHAADDNVFVQFYPVLKREMVKQGRWVESAHAVAETDPDEGE